MSVRAGVASLVAWSALAGCHDDGWLQYPWDDRTILCSVSVDDISQHAAWGEITTELERARDHESVALMHAHGPGLTITTGAIERLFNLADDNGLAYVTYPELVPTGTPRAGLALGFDDNAIDQWYEMRPLFLARGARVTFFVTRFHSRTPEELAKLAELAADGHAIEAHSVAHLNVRDYVRDNGLAAYLAEEALPSITRLRDAGYAPTSYAYPFGRDHAAANTALLDHVSRIRVSPGVCPH
ncbi:MAG: polysaccharide deacetylase family protein [Deltaproteobacteria bacterium]|nr:polysaccharide deacetylase family protein [Deltaproteobacteria bacterium]MDQ3296019.1 polysaccharide deacetylase family protein [Myxococcota bacterium]